jgi:diacylglycerol kinase (ATP)
VRLAFVLNPAAQNRRAARARAQLAAALDRRGVRATLAETEAPGHATRLAAALAADHDAVVAVGGDGTVQEVARGLYGTGAALGVLPFGTGNDFAHALGMPDPFEQALDALLAAPVRPVDLGRVRWEEEDAHGARVVREGLFVNCVGAGFDGLVALGVPRYKWMGGQTAYLAAVMRALRLWRQPGVQIAVAPEPGGAEPGGVRDDGALVPAYAGPLFLVMICNGHSVGGGFLLTPESVPDDGRLDVCVVGAITLARTLRLLPMTFTGGHVGAPEVTMRRAGRIVVRAEAPLPVQADGEVISLGAHTLEVEVLPGALRALAPGLAPLG